MWVPSGPGNLDLMQPLEKVPKKMDVIGQVALQLANGEVQLFHFQELERLIVVMPDGPHDFDLAGLGGQRGKRTAAGGVEHSAVGRGDRS